MPKTEKTIDGFVIRKARDSRLVSHSQSVQLASAARKTSSSDPFTKATISKKYLTPAPKHSTAPKPKIKAHPISVKAARAASTSAQAAPRRPVANTRPAQGKSAASFSANSAAADAFTAPVAAFGADEASTQDNHSANLDNSALASSNSDGFGLDQTDSQDSYIDPITNPSDSTIETELADAAISELSPEEAKALHKNLRADTKSAKTVAGKQGIEDDWNEDSSAKHLVKPKSPIRAFFKAALKALLIVLAILVLVALVAAFFLGDYLNGLIQKITGGNDTIWSAVSTITKETYDPLKTDAHGRTNILIFGTSGYSMSNPEHDGANLTDTIMVVSIDQNNGDVAMVNLPRDLKAGRTCTATGKVNEVYWCANMYDEDEAAGAAALQAKIQEILGVETQYYIHVNWGALVSIVDAIGGIQVTLDEDIADYGWTDAAYQAGVEYTLNGAEALGLARARHGTQYGDFTRGNSQQKILIAIKNKIISNGLGLSNMLDLMNVLGENFRTNLTIPEIKTAAHLAEMFDLDSMRQVPLVNDDVYYMTTANINNISYVVPAAGIDNYSALHSYVDSMLNSDPVQREDAPIEILNGSGETGLADAERGKLELKGFRVQEIGNAPEGTYPEEVTLYDTSEGKAPSTLAALEKYYHVSAQPESALPAGISGYGFDFIVILGGTASTE